MMRRYHYLPVLSRKGVTEMARVAYLSLEECDLLPRSSCDVTEHIYDILKGEAWEYIAAYRRDIVLLLKEWEHERDLRFAADRALREEQEKLYAEACMRDSLVLPHEKECLEEESVDGEEEFLEKEKWYHFRNHEKRVRVSLTPKSKMKTILETFAPLSSVTAKTIFTLISTGKSLQIDAEKTLQEYNLRGDVLYHLELV